jgi:hypothetical protein
MEHEPVYRTVAQRRNCESQFHSAQMGYHSLGIRNVLMPYQTAKFHQETPTVIDQLAL